MKLSSTTGNNQGSRNSPIVISDSADSDDASESDSLESQQSERKDGATQSSCSNLGSGKAAASEQSAERSCSKYKGISYHKKRKLFIAQLRGCIGCYKSLMEAVRAYNEKARKLGIKEHVVSSKDVNEVRSQIKVTHKSRTLRRKKRRSCEYKKAYFHSDDESEGHSQSEATRKSRREQRRKRGSSSKYKGVYLNKRVNRYVVQITHDNKRHYLGLYDSEKDAARAYNQEARKLGKERNVIRSDDESDGRSQSKATLKSRRPQHRNCGSPNNKCRDRNKEDCELGKEDQAISDIGSSSDDEIKVGSGLRSSTSNNSPRQNNFQEEMKSSNRAAIYDNNDNNEEDGNDSSGNSVIIDNNTVSSFSKSERKVNAQRININRPDGVQHRIFRNEPHESSNPLLHPNALCPSHTVIGHMTYKDFHLSFMPPHRNWVFGAFAELYDNAKDAGATEFQIDLHDKDDYLRFQDNGAGMAPELLRRAVVKRFTTKVKSDFGGYGEGLKSGIMGIGEESVIFTVEPNKPAGAIAVISQKRAMRLQGLTENDLVSDLFVAFQDWHSWIFDPKYPDSQRNLQAIMKMLGRVMQKSKSRFHAI